MKARRLALPAVAVALVALFHLTAWGSYADFSASIDFNRGALEDFMGPYYTTAGNVLAGDGPARGFYYSPFFALLLAPLGSLEPGPASWIWLAIEFLATAALVLLPLALVRPRTSRGLAAYLCAAGLSFPLVHNLHWGQVSVPLTAAMLAALVAWQRGRRRTSSWVLAVPVAIKFYPALVLAHFVLREEWRHVARTLAIAVLLGAALPTVVLGPAETWEFYRAVGAGLREAQGGGWGDAPSKQHAPAVLARLLGVEGRGAYAALQGLSYAAALGALVLARRVGREPGAAGAPTAWAVLLCAFPLVLSPCWPHYFAWLPFAQLCVASRGGAATRAVVALSAVLASAPFFRWQGSPADYGNAGWLLLANVLVLCAAALPRARSVTRAPRPGADPAGAGA